MSLDDLYQELLLDHFKSPRCQGTLIEPSASSSLRNPLCGDKVDLALKVRDGTIEQIAFTGQGCSISQASASMMTSLLRGQSLSAARDRLAEFQALMRGEGADGDLSALGDAAALAGVRRFSARIRCALLAWEALDQCLQRIDE